MIRQLFSESFTSQVFADKSILLVGAGGLGCEICKLLSMSGFGRLDIVDLDVIEYSNLNRQFYFDEHDMWKAKADVTVTVMKNKLGEYWPLFY